MLAERFNIANGETHTMLEVFEAVKDLMGVDLQKHHVKPRLGDPRKSNASISRAQQIILYDPKVGFLDGMEKTAEWWKAGCPIK
jgi:nucleoside-diphosphate-sugar epimerase